MKKLLKPLILSLLLLACFHARAQYFKPNWVNDIGGTSDSKATNIVADNSGNIYISGYIRGTVTFNLKEGGSKTLTSNGDADIYIAKYVMATGNYEWAISMGGSGLEQPNSMTLDPQGNVLITGQFQGSVNFNPAGNFPLTANGSDDVFVAKYTSAGNFVWAISMGGSDIDRGHYVATDSQGNVFITGSYTGAVDVDPSAGTSTLPSQGSLAGFFAKYNANGNFVWAHPLGVLASQGNLVNLTIDKTTNDVVIDGDFSGNVDFSYTGNAAATFNSPTVANFVARYTNNGAYEWVRYLPGSGSGILASVKVDNQSNIIITGNFGGQFYANGPAGTALTANGANDLVVASYKANGTLNWAENFGSNTGDVNSRYVAIDANNNIFITGYFTGTVNISASLSEGILNNNGGGRSIMLVGLNSSGTPIAAGAIGGCSLDLGYEITAVNGNIYVAGAFCGTADFDTGSCNTDNVTAVNSTSDSFLASFTIIPGGAITNNVITAPNPAAACGPATPATITATTPTGGSGTYTYQWQSSPDGIIFTDIANATSLTYTPGTISADTYYRRIVSSLCAVPLISNIVMIQLQAVLANNAITAPAITAFCSSGDPDNIVGSRPTGGDGVNYSYRWQSSTDGTTFTDIAGATNVDYDPPPLTTTTYYRRTITSGACTTPLISNVIKIAIEPPLANNVLTAPAITAFCSGGDPASITGSTPTGGDGTNYIYQWQSSLDGTNFINIAGATALNYDPPVVNATTYYRRIVTSPGCTVPLISNVIVITIEPPLANNIITAPAVTTFCSTGDPANIAGSTATGGDGVNYTYQWQSSTDGATFTDIAGAASVNYDPPAVSVTTYYRRVVTTPGCPTPLISNVVIITVQPPLANNTITAPAVTSFCSSGDPGPITASTPTGGSGIYTYQWQISTDNTTFTDISGATGASYDPPLLNTTTYYRRTVTSGSCNVPLVSASIGITITPAPVAPVPTASVVNICAGTTATLSVASPQAGITYDWYDSPAKTNHLFTGTSYTTGPLNTGQTFYIEASSAASCSSPALGSVHVNVSSPPSPPVVTGTTSVCNGTSATLNIQNPQAGLTYNWYSAQSGGAALHTGDTYITPGVSGNVTYYVDATNSGGCISLNRTPINLTVKPAPTVSAEGTTTCPGTTTTLLATTNDNNASINWYTAATGGSPIFTGAFFTTPALNTNTTYYAEAADNITGCISASRAQVQVLMIQALDAPVVTVSATTTSSVTFQWAAVSGATGYQVSTNNGQTFTDPSSGSNGLTHTVSNLQAQQSVTVIVRAIGSSACAQSGNSDGVTGTAASPQGDQVFVPNAFTPNADGKNDIVYVRGPNIRSLKFYVYDQWGELIYSTANLTGGWDGTYKGSKEPVGVYVYYVEAMMNDGTQVNKKGSITLLR